MISRRIRFCTVLPVLVIGLAPFLGCSQETAKPAGYPLSYTLPSAGQVSLAIYDANSRLVREVLRAQSQPAGPHTLYWDGMDASCRPLSGGTYHWKLLLTGGLTTEYVMTLGVNARPDYNDWPGDHGGPVSVEVDDTGMYVGAGCAETTPTLVKQTLDGRYLYHLNGGAAGFEPWQGALKMCSTGGRLYVLHGTGTVVTLNSEDGNKIGKFHLGLPVVRLDFKHGGNAPAPGWKAVTLEPYRAETGYGWKDANGISSADNGPEGDSMKRDFHVCPSGKEKVFVLDYKDGSYQAKVHWGDAKAAHPNMEIWIGGNGRPSVSASTKAGEVATSEFNVEVKEGKLELRFRNKEPGSGDWVVNGLELYDGQTRIAAGGQEFVACFPRQGVVQWVNPADGNVLASAPLSDVKDVALALDNTALAIAGQSVVSMARGDRAGTERIGGLTAPRKIAVDRVSGDIFIVEANQSQQIKRYSADYQLKSVYGKAGGRPLEGLYDQPTSFQEVDGIAGDGQGGFLICEGGIAPRRTSHLDANGMILNEWYGGQMFFQYACPDPADANLVWMDSQWGWVMQAQVDYPRKSWKVRATYRYGGGDGLLPGSKLYGGWHVFHRGGKTCLWADFGYPRIYRIDEPNRRMTPLAASGVVDVGPKDLAKYPKPWVAAVEALGLDPNDSRVREAHRGWTWADANGEGDMDPREFRLTEMGQWSFSSLGFMDEGCNAYLRRNSKQTAWDVLSPQGWTKAGAPLWDWRQLTLGPANTLKGDPSGFWRDDQGNTYLCFKGGGEGYPHGQTWSSDLYDGTGLVKLDPKGNVLWQVAPHATRKDSWPGQLYDPIRILGKSHDCVFVGQRIIDPLEIWTDDGLYVGGAFHRRAADGLPERLYHWWRVDWDKPDSAENKTPIQYDCLAGGALYTWASGEVFWYAPGWNNTPVYRITGWEDWQRQQGTVVLGTPSGSGLRGEYFNNKDLAGPGALVRIDPTIRFNWEKRSPDEPDPAEVTRRDNEYKTSVKAWEARKDANLPRPTSQPFASPVVRNQDFSIRWTGFVQAPLSEEFIFSTYNKDGVRLWVDGQLLIDNWKNWSGEKLYSYSRNEMMTRNVSKPIALQAGRRYAIRLEYYKDGPTRNDNTAQVHLNWESPTLQRQHVPQSALYPQ